MTDNQQCFMWC